MAPLTIADLRARAAQYGPLPWVGEIVIEPVPEYVAPSPETPTIPVGGRPIDIVVHGLEYVWDDVSSWWDTTWHSVSSWFTSGLSISKNAVETVVTDAINLDITAWSSMVNLLQADLGRLSALVVDDLIDLTGYVARGLWAAEQFAQTIGDYVGGVLEAEIQGIEAEITGLEDFLSASIGAALAGIEAWAIDNIYHPLLDDIITTAGDIYDAIQATAEWTIAEVEGLVNAETLARIGALAGLAAIVASLAQTLTVVETITNECTVPMCEVMGPNTDLFKWLKALNFLADAALLAELAAMNANDIDNLMRGLVRLGGGIVDDIDAIFTGGLNVGQALAQTGA